MKRNDENFCNESWRMGSNRRATLKLTCCGSDCFISLHIRSIWETISDLWCKAKFVLKFLRTICSEIWLSFFSAAHEFFTYLRSSAAVFCQALLLCAAAFSYAARSEYAGVTSSNPTWGWAFCPQEQWHEFENHLSLLPSARAVISGLLIVKGSSWCSTSRWFWGLLNARG